MEQSYWRAVTKKLWADCGRLKETEKEGKKSCFLELLAVFRVVRTETDVTQMCGGVLAAWISSNHNDLAALEFKNNGRMKTKTASGEESSCC